MYLDSFATCQDEAPGCGRGGCLSAVQVQPSLEGALTKVALAAAVCLRQAAFSQNLTQRT